MRSSSPTAFRLSAWTLVASSLLLLNACGRGGKVEEAPRPVLVTHPVASDHTASAFAGDVRAREDSPLSFRVGGKLVQRNVDVGDHVRAGQVLATLDPGDLQAQARAAQAQLAAAEAELGRARADQARFAKLANEQLVSRSTLDAQNAAATAAQGQVNAARAEVEVASNQAAYSQLRATRDGVIAARQAEAGQVVAAGQTVFTLAGDAGREVAIALPETRIRDFHAGQRVLVELWNAPGTRLPGTIREIAPAADPQARTYAARIALGATAAQAVELGQSARVYIADDGGTDGNHTATLRVPLAAVQRGPSGATALWVVDPATRKLHLTPVQLGAFGEDSVPVLRGVAVNAWIVAAGGHLLREGQLVTPVDRDNRPVFSPAVAAK